MHWITPATDLGNITYPYLFWSLCKWSGRKGKSNTLIYMEHTGVYRQLLITKLVEKQAKFGVEVPIQIIRSIEVQRGTEISPFCPNFETSGLSKN